MLRLFLDRKIYLLLLILLAGAIVAIYFNNQLQQFEENQRRDTLENVHQGVVDKFSESLDRFAYLMSGLRSHLRYSEDFPNEYEMQKFIKYQADELTMNDSLIVSFLDTNHEFIYSFTLNEIDPSSLVGTSVKDFRNGTEIKRLDTLLSHDQMRLFPPLNLIEGWVGIPLNFPVIRNGESIGYIASILNFRNIIEPIYELQDTDEFAFKFSVKNGASFDREQVHDQSKVYHKRNDDKYYKNYLIDNDQFIHSDLTAYGLTFKIGTSYISENTPNPYIRWIFLFIYGLIVIFAVFALYRYIVYQQLNERLKKAIKTTNEQNTKLEELNNTKNRLMSIIGHDLKGPISSIINLMSLVEESSISIEDTKSILKQLNPVTKNTISLLENLLQWAMVNSDNTLYRPEQISVNKIIEENFNLLQSVADQKNISLVKNTKDDIEAYADYNMISTVIRNLVSNALKYSFPDTKVEVRAFQLDQKVIIEVQDQGIGLSQKEIDLINSSEVESSRQGTAGEKGTGLGLTLCIAFLKKNHGSLNIESQVGSGSTFKIMLPYK